MGIGDRKRRPPLLVWLLFRAPRRWGVTDSRIKRLGSFERNYNWMYSLNIQSGPLLSTYRVKVIHFSCEEKFNFSLTLPSRYLRVESWWGLFEIYFKADKMCRQLRMCTNVFTSGLSPSSPNQRHYCHLPLGRELFLPLMPSLLLPVPPSLLPWWINWRGQEATARIGWVTSGEGWTAANTQRSNWLPERDEGH